MRRCLLLIAITLTACRTAPPPMTAERVHAMDAPTLCQTAGRTFALNDIPGFQLVMTEIGNRNDPIVMEVCIALAQMGANSVAADAARRQAMGDAFKNGMGEMQKAFQPKPAATCTTIANTTNCQSH